MVIKLEKEILAKNSASRRGNTGSIGVIHLNWA